MNNTAAEIFAEHIKLHTPTVVRVYNDVGDQIAELTGTFSQTMERALRVAGDVHFTVVLIDPELSWISINFSGAKYVYDKLKEGNH